MELTVLWRVSFTLLLLLGVPVAFSIGLASVATILVRRPAARPWCSRRWSAACRSSRFLAIPFFVFAGELMLYGGIADRIVRFANSLVGHVRGGLGMSNVRRLHAVRRRGRLAAGRRVGHGLGDDPADEEGGLPRRLRGQRDDPRGPGRRADADLAQPDHLHAGHHRHRLGQRAGPDPRGPRPGAASSRCATWRRPTSSPSSAATRRAAISPAGARWRAAFAGGAARAAGDRRSSWAASCRASSPPPNRPRRRCSGPCWSPCSSTARSQLGALPESLRQGLQDDRRGAAADRHLGGVRLLHGAVRGAAEDRRADVGGHASSRG